MGRWKRGWKAASGLSLADLRHLIDEKSAQLDELRARRKKVASELADVEAEIAASADENRRGREPGTRALGRPRKAIDRHRGRSKRMVGRSKLKRRGRATKGKGQSPLHDSIHTVLKASSEPMKLAAIADGVKSAGYKTKSPNFSAILGLRLSEMSDVERVERGVYAIR